MKSQHVPESAVDDYLAWAERALIDFGPIEDIANGNLRKSEKIKAVLGHPLMGNASNRKNIDSLIIEQKLTDSMHRRLPLFLVLPAFPFKDQGAFNTESRPDEPDFGEVALMVRMHCLALGLSRLHAEQVQWIILSDGPLYAPIFGLAPGLAERYLNRIRAFRDSLNLRSTIHVLSLKDVVAKSRFSYGAASGIDAFTKYVADIRHTLESLSRVDAESNDALQALTQDMMWNIDTRRYGQSAASQDIWNALRGQKRSPLYSELYEQSRETTLRYMACNIALRLSRAIECQFPFALRATSHAKKGQVAIPRLGHVAPWNGVAVLRRRGRGWADLESMRMYRAWQEGANVRAHLEGNEGAFFYEIS
uniref:Isocyanide synthase family protein n=1 Tax=Streptomyces sp. NBC_01393 TaxID=2903851 RepID=A0AAU3HWX8_9ACTN